MRAVVVVLVLLFAGCATEGVVQREVAEDEWIEFVCVPYSPCARIRAEAPGGATGYRLDLDADLHAGYSAQALVDGAPLDLGGYGFGPGQVGPYEGRLPAGKAEAWTFTFSPMSGERGAKVRMHLTWIRDAPTASMPLCSKLDVSALYSAEELAARVEVLKESPRERALCVLGQIAPRITTWNGSRYADLGGDINRERHGVDGETWAVTLRGDHGGAPDIWHFRVEVVDEQARVEGGLSSAGALPPERVERARLIFEATPEAAEVRERAPHLLRNSTRWEPGGRVVLTYDATAEGSAGIPERPFARVSVDVEKERVESIERSLWW